MGEALGAMGINGPFLISQIVNFLLLFGVLTVLLWKPAKKRLDERQAMLQKQVEDTEAAAQEREKIGLEREKALAEAKQEAEKIIAQAQDRVASIKADAEEQAKGIIQKAREDAKQEELNLLKSVRDQVGVLAIAATQKLLGAALDESRQKALVDEFFSGVKSGKIVVLEGEQFEGESAVVTSALPLSDKEKEIIEKDILKRSTGDIAVAFEVEPDLLGGLTIRVGDKIVDHSVLAQLTGMRALFS
ncbi:MAG TPA: ATP synthase F0 subunit B [Chloroflexi bacterium]|nr:MAG: ATP synthase F0 subunit B [Chloroflexota bacterium]HDD56354.1 ATP synthase F0 subunit B [Chloroflexota bacterium]